MNKKIKSIGRKLLIKKIIIISVICVTVITGTFYFLNKEKVDNFLGFENNEEITDKEKEQTNADTTDVTFATQYLIDSNNPSIQLINPKNNTVNMQFTVYVDGKKIEETKLVKPNAAKSLNLKKILKKGMYKMDVKIRTYDVDTNKECNPIPVNGIKVTVD